MPTLSSLRTFEAAARTKSFKRAADELHVTESSVSHQVKSLEAQLGVTLFDRFHRRVVLTPDGISLMIVLTKAFDDISVLCTQMKSRESIQLRPSSRLVVACDPGFAHYWLRPRLLRQANLRDVEIIPTNQPARELLERATLAIHYGWRVTGAYHSEEIARTTVFPVCSPELSRELVEAPEDGNGRAWPGITLLHDRTLRMWGEWIRSAGIQNVDWQSGQVFHSSALCIQAAVEGEGIALGNELNTHHLIETGRLVKPFDHAIDPSGYRWFLVNDSSLRNSRHADFFREWLLSELDKILI